MNNAVVGSALVAVGLLCILGAALNWSIIMRPGKLFNRLAGEAVARVVYIAIGFVLIVLGALRFGGTSLLGR
ncbi:MAG: hypothetical protein M1282_19430 [Chloroflexi bacterium]|nr:hypothetical protein [Chloroflexota bacterium]